MKIHPTAIVSPEADLAEDVEIGPWAIVGPRVRLGAGCVVHARAVLDGDVVMGERNVVGIGVVVGPEPQDFAFAAETRSGVRVGDGNTFREYVTIHRGTKPETETVVGNGCYLMVGTHLGHNVRLGNNVIIANNCLLAGYVEVMDGAVLGGGTVFHQFMRVGALAMVPGGARFGKDIPPYVAGYGENQVSGINLVGLRRAGFSSDVRMEIKRAFKLLYWSGLNMAQAVEEAEKREWGAEARVFWDFVKSSRRGMCVASREES